MDAPVKFQRKAIKRNQEDGMDRAMEFHINRIKDVNLGYAPMDRLIDAKRVMEKQFEEQARGIEHGSFAPVTGITWAERGPNNIGGRCRALAFDLSDAANGYKKVWAGGVGGGLWVTNDITVATPVWTKQNDLFDNLAVTTFAQSPANNSNMFFGTGEGFYNADAIRGLGIWRSTNGGTAWAQLASTNNASFHYVTKIVVNSTGTIFASTRNGGLQRSTNNGDTWSKVLGLGVNSVGGAAAIGDAAADVEVAANGHIYCSFGLFSTGAIYRSTDGGTSWTQLNPGVAARRIELACAPSNSNIVYALFHSDATQNCSAIRRYDASTNTWTACTVPTIIDQGSNSNFTRGQAWYDLIAAVDPNNANSLYIGGIDALRSDNAGATWTQMSTWSLFAATGFGAAQNVHADQHAIVYRPGSSSVALWGTDGGVDYTANANVAATSKPTWVRKSTGFNVTQYYSVAIHPTTTNYFLGGAQDNGSHSLNSAGIGAGTTRSGGDGAFAHIDQQDGNIQITSFTNNNYTVTTNGWTSSTSYEFTGGSFINPTDYDSEAKILYGGFGGGSYFRWTSPATGGAAASITIPQMFGADVTHVTVSPLTFNRIYLGLSTGSVVQVDNANSATPTAKIIKPAGGPFASVSCVAIDPSDENHILITYSNFGALSVLESTNALATTPTWTNQRGNLPDIPVYWAMFDPRNADWAILATEMGIWSTNDLNAGATDWGATNNGFANVRVDMLQYRASDRTLAAATHGRGIFTTVIPANTTPAIAFNSGLTSTPETGNTLVGCRSYKDYNASLRIEAAPTGNATINFNVAAGNTATLSTDFQFTTNGNFTAPSNEGTFASGSTASIPITIRVFDDNTIEGPESFNLQYTISGGSNAIRGSGPQTLSFQIVDNDTVPLPPYSLTREIGSPDVGYFIPFLSSVQRSRSQFIYLASELQASGLRTGNITSLGLEVFQKNSTMPFSGFTVKLKNTATAAFPAIITGATLFEGGMTQVFNGNVTTFIGQNTINFNTPFEWDGTSNLMVEFCFNNAAADVDDDVVVTELTGGILSMFTGVTGGSTVGCSLPPTFNSAGGTDFVRPVITFAGTAGNSIQTRLNATSTVYFGPNADLYIYDNTGSILARLKNQTAFDYGCTQVIVDRAGSSAAMLYNNNVANSAMDKTVRIIPTNNNPTGNYTITLYYRNNEVNGWEAVTARPFNTIKLIKVQNAIANVTPSTPFGGGALQRVTPTFGTYGTGKTLQYNFATGFSGFGAGGAASALSIKLIQFTGENKGNFNRLNWLTTGENSNRGFHVERSFDGVTFASIAFVTNAGLSAGQNTFDFDDKELPKAVAYYRLKFIENDGRVQYSSTVIIKTNNTVDGFNVISNPVNGILELQFEAGSSGIVDVQLVDAAGKVVFRKSVQLNAAASIYKLSLPKENIPPGVYFVTAILDGKPFSQKIVKN